MTLLPVVERELRVASRRSWTYWSRAGAALLAILVSSWFLLLQGTMGLGALGKPLFGTLSFLSFVFAAFAGVTHSADSVSSEKREGTLGLLFLTDLRGFDVTLGKLAASSLGAVYSLFASLPVLAMALLLGGVTAGEYWRMVLLLVDLLLMSLAAGMCVSVFSKDGRRAALGTFVVVLLVLFLMPAVMVIVHYVLVGPGQPWGPVDELLKRSVMWMSPVTAYGWAFDVDYRSNTAGFWRSVAFTAVLTALFLALASWRLPRSWQDTGADGGKRGGRRALERLRFPDRSAKDRHRARLLDLSPVAWLAARHWLRPALVWVFLAGAAVVFLSLARWVGNDWWNGASYITTSILVHLVLKVWIANEGPRQFAEDHRDGALELLLSTPLSVAELLRGRFVALRRQFAGPVVAVLVVDAVFLLGSASRDVSSSEDQFHWALLWVLRMAFLAFDAVTLSWLGLWSGMTSGNRSTWVVLVRGIILPWLVCLASMSMVAMASVAARGDIFTPTRMLVGWALIGTASNVLWIVRARRSLTTGFRELATRRPGQSRGWFRGRAATTA